MWPGSWGCIEKWQRSHILVTRVTIYSAWVRPASPLPLHLLVLSLRKMDYVRMTVLHLFNLYLGFQFQVSSILQYPLFRISPLNLISQFSVPEIPVFLEVPGTGTVEYRGKWDFVLVPVRVSRQQSKVFTPKFCQVSPFYSTTLIHISERHN